MALAMSLWKETRSGEEIFGQVETCNLDLYHPSIGLTGIFFETIISIAAFWQVALKNLKRKIYAYEIKTEVFFRIIF